MRGVTHAGKFHAGDVFSTALLQIVFGYDFEVERVEVPPEALEDEVANVDADQRQKQDRNEDHQPLRRPPWRAENDGDVGRAPRNEDKPVAAKKTFVKTKLDKTKFTLSSCTSCALQRKL